MSEAGKKQNFLHGAAWLALATIVVKIIGAIFKFPLQAIIGDAGYAYFTTAYDIYSVLMTIATAGLPLALSRMTSAANALGHGRQVRRIFKAGRFIYLTLGFIGMMLMLLFCKSFSASLGQSDACIAVACLAPSAFLISYMSAFRGFFQGQGNMRPTSQSQMLESVIKLVVGLAFAYLLKEFTGSLSYAAAGGIIGVTISCLVSTVFLRSKFTPAWNQLGNSPEGVTSYRSIMKGLLIIAIPITIGSAGLQFLNVMEMGLYMDNLNSIAGNPNLPEATLSLVNEIKAAVLLDDPKLALNQAKLVENIAASMKGIYNFMYTFFNMPVSLIGPITISVLPAITEQLTLKRYDMVRETEESAARVTGLLALPCGVGMTLLARPIASLLRYTGYRLDFAATILTILGLCIFFYASVTFTNSILQSHNYAYIPVINTVVCGVARLGLVYYLTSNPYIHAIGIPISGMFSFVSILILNMIAIRCLAPQKPQLLRNLLRPLLPAAIMGVAVAFTLYCLKTLLHVQSAVILCGVCVAVGIVIYALAVILLKTIKKEDCLLLPKGQKIAKLLHL